MSLQLDARQRAMLAEMGVTVWAPKAAADHEAPVAEVAVLKPETPVPAQTQAAQRRAGAGGPALATPIAPAMAPAQARPVAPELVPPVEAAVSSPILKKQDAVPAAVAHDKDGEQGIPGVEFAKPTHAGTLATQELAALARVDAAEVAHMDWANLQSSVAACRACRLCERRTQPVFGVGAQRADWMVVGEAPGEQEDRRGEPFVGPAGQLLDAMLQAVGVSRMAPVGERAVYIANVLKCRPPGNRNPQPDEVAQCEPYLQRQVALVQPKLILALGRFAVQSLLGTTEPIGRLRQQVHQYQGVPVVVSYHPAYLLRNLPDKAKAWADLVLAMRVAGKLGP